jgi:hypothetical protein
LTIVLEYIAGENFQGFTHWVGILQVPGFCVLRRLLQVAPRLAFEIVMGYVIPTMDKDILKEPKAMKLEDNSEAVPPDTDALTLVTLDDFISAHLGNKLMDLVRCELQKLLCNSSIQDGLFPCVAVERIVEAVLD